MPQDRFPPLYRQVADDLRRRILAGEIAPGRRLPSTRELAGRQGISRFTVLEAYGLLVQEGYLVSRQGSGHFAARPVVPEQRGPRNLLPGEADPRLFPAEEWAGLLERHLQDAQPAETDPLGSFRLREAMAGILSRRLRAPVPPQQVVVTAGGQDGLHLVSRFLGTGSHGVEDPGYRMWQETLRLGPNRLVPLPAADEDRFLAELGRQKGPWQSLHLTADGQMPLGTVLSHPGRQAVLEWARRTGTPVLDDGYQELFLWQPPPPSLWTLAAGQGVIRVGSWSRLLTPAAHLGYLLIPPQQAGVFARLRQTAGGGLPPAVQAALADFFERRHLDRLLDGARPVYQRRGQAFAHALRSAGLQDAVRFPAAGLHLSVRLPDGNSGQAAVAALAARGILCRALSNGEILLSFAMLSTEEATGVARIVAKTVAEHGSPLLP